MNTTLLFFLLLIPLSGFIAWAGDRIGYRIGRRRQTLFGLRPRHTAVVITIATGIGITLASFGGMLALSRSFRNVISRGAALARDNQVLQDDNARLSRDIDSAGARVRALRKEAQRAEVERADALKARDAALAQQARAQRDVADARRQLRNAETVLAGERRRLGTAQSALRDAQAQLQVARKAVEDAQARRVRAETLVKEAETRTRAALADAETARQKVTTAERVFEQVMRIQKERLDEQRTLLRTQEADLERQRQRLREQETRIAAQDATIQGQNDRLSSQTVRAEAQRAELDRLTTEVADLARKRDEYQVALNDMIRSADALRSQRVTFRVGEEVARLPLAPGASIWKVQNALEGFLTAAAKKAEGRGARTGRGALRAVWIPSRMARTDDGRLEAFSEMDALHAAALAIRAANEDVVVVLSATANAVAGEPVPVDLHTYRNPLLFSAGALLGEITLPAGRPRQEVLDMLYGFLSGEIRRRLIKAGVIPVSPGAGLEGEPIGETGMDALLKVMEDVRLTGRARIIVRAARDLRAGDFVALDFEVRPVEAPPEHAR